MKPGSYIQLHYLIIMLLVTAGSIQYAGAETGMNKPVALEGYDPVAYFTIGQAKKGNEKFTYQWKGETWLFSSSQHLDKFRAAPQQYLPQFNGVCANGLSDGHAVTADPNNWRIIDGKLYLFFSEYGRNQWAGDVKGLIESAEQTFQEN